MVAGDRFVYAPLALFAARASHLAAPLSFLGVSRVATDEQHIALPQLYGAPAYARPPAMVVPERPFDPDELPIEAFQTDEEREFRSTLPPRAFAPGGVKLPRDAGSVTDAGGNLQPRAFSLKRITRILGGS
jgi:hypothetical protein